MFEMFVPRSSRHEDEAIIEIRKAESWIFNSHKADLNNYVREFLLGEHYSLKDIGIHIVKQRTSRIGWDDGSGIETYVHLRFRVDGFEPDGANQLWWNMMWFDDEESCTAGENCFGDENLVVEG